MLELDANTLVKQLNKASPDLPGALMTRWLAWIQLFDFDVKHVPGHKHGAPDGFSRRPATEEDIREAEEEQDIDDFIDTRIYMQRVFITNTDIAEEEVNVVDTTTLLLEPGYSTLHQDVARFLSTLQNHNSLEAKEFRKFKAYALKFLVQDRYLFRRASKNIPLRRVVDDVDTQTSILQELHDECGHRGREGTYRKVADRYWWPKLFKDVQAFVKSCEQCQRRASGREEEALHPTWVSVLWEKVAIDIVHMPPAEGKTLPDYSPRRFVWVGGS